MVHVIALAGVLSISFSAVFIRLAAVSPVTAAFFRAVYALPVLALLWRWGRARDRRPARARALAAASGILLAADLASWHQSIALVGAGLGTVIANVQVVFVALAGWAWRGDRPTGRAWALLAGVLAGVALTSGLARPDAYGASPVAGVLFGVLAGACYAAFLLLFRAANEGRGPGAGPLLDSTVGTALGSLLVMPLDPHVSFTPVWPAHGWLLALALVSQVLGWLCIGFALARLAPLEASVLLLLQPVFAIVWGRLLFDEQLSWLQWVGTVLVLGGVTSMASGRLTRRVAERV
ncbi:MAG: DMT family transporter [Vicinamibacterales bacterium]